MSLETALRELGKEIQKDERFIKLQACAKANDADEELQKKMQELQLLSLKFQQEMQKGEEADKDRITELQTEYQTQYNEVMQTPNMMNYSVAASEMAQVAQYISSMIGLCF
ncbi:MAG: YlbF family regulator, partial [Eubacterium sp.]|nr:YlbF family regulator [Eubacterium sp.]